MEANAVEPQKESVQAIVKTTLSEQQLYHHDPLLFLLKERLHLRNLWMSVGALLLPGIVYLAWWLLWGSKLSSGWNPGNIASLLLQTFVLFPSLFFIYDGIPNAIAKTFNTLYTDDVIGKYRKDPSDREAYTRSKQQMIYWMDNNWWTATIIVVIILYALLRLFLRELPDRQDLLPLVVRAVVIIIYVPLMFATGMSVIRLVLALIFVNRLLPLIFPFIVSFISFLLQRFVL